MDIMDRNDTKVEKLVCIRKRSNDNTNGKYNWYQIAQHITYCKLQNLEDKK